MKPIRPMGEASLSRCADSVDLVLRGNISYGDPVTGADNIDGAWATGTTPGVANTEFAVTHNLNRIPNGFDVKRMDKAARFYDSGTAWTKTQIFLKCDVVTVKYTLFIH